MRNSYLRLFVVLSSLLVLSAAENGFWTRVSHLFSGRQAETCGDGICSVTRNETCLSCAEDCCPNDVCSSAKELVANEPGKVYSFHGADNSTSLGLSSFCLSSNADLWFFYRPQQNGYLTVSTCNNGTNTDTTLSIFVLSSNSTTNSTQGNTTTIDCSDSNLITLACKDDDLEDCPANPLDTTIRQKVVQGFTYLIQVASFNFEASFGYLEISAVFEASSNVTSPVCGDNLCDELEICSSCPQDCCSNDNCSNPILVAFTPSEENTTEPPLFIFTHQGSTQGATLGSEILNTRCTTTPLSPDVWFLIEEFSENGFVSVSTCSGSTFDTTLSIFLVNSTSSSNTTSGNTTAPLVNCTELTELNCNNDAGSISCTSSNPKASTLYQIIEKDKQYMVRLAGEEVNSGRYTIEFQFFPGNFSTVCGDGVCDILFEDCGTCSEDCCPNDVCDNAIHVNLTSSVTNLTFFGNTKNASLDLTLPLSSQFCTLPSPDTWYWIKPPSDGELTISTCSNFTTFDTALALFTQPQPGQNTTGDNSSFVFPSNCGLLTLVSCIDDFNCSVNPLSSTITANVSASETYILRVGGYNDETFGWYEVSFSFSSSGGNVTGTGTPATTTDGGGTTIEVVGTDFQWSPASVTLKVGDTIHWSWTGTHNVAESASETALTGTAGGFTSGPCCATDSEFSHTFDTAGTFHYLCEAHAALGMRGVVVVEA